MSTLGDVIGSFMRSNKFRNLSRNSQLLWGHELKQCLGSQLGGALVRGVRPADIEDYLDGFEDRPGKQQAAFRALKAVEKWAYKRDLLSGPICYGVETGKPTGGHIPWTPEHVRLGRMAARPDLARVVTLGAFTGQRKSDLVRMCWEDIETYKGRRGINVTQQKTGVQVWVPIIPELADAMASWKRLPGPILKRMKDNHGTEEWTREPWTSRQLGAAWYWEVNNNPDLRELQAAGLVLHGLRGHACVTLCRAGATTRQVADMVGMSEKMVSVYTRLSSQKDNALAAMAALERT